MSGSIEGGRAAALTNKRKYGENHYSVIGKVGGSKGRADGVIKGFDANRELARYAGAIGGRKSRRKPAKKVATD